MGIEDQIRARGREIGFDVVGFAPAELNTETGDGFDAFLAAGHQGDMGWLVEKRDRRLGPRALWAGTRSVISLGLAYTPKTDPRAGLADRHRGVISVYAQGRDYHLVVKKRLKELAGWMHRSFDCEVKVFVDTAPVMEKPLAQAAGIGWQGKHTNLVSRRHGSWLFLGEIYTDLELAPDRPVDQPETEHCGACRACQDICPTGAFPAPYKIDARRCISYLTIEHQGPIDRQLRPLMGNRIYGCDDCLAVCPWNKFATPTTEPDFLPRAELTAPRLAELATLDDAEFRTLFSSSPIKRLGRDRFIRNVAIAIGNSDAPGLIKVAEVLLDDGSALVRGAAVWALDQLHTPQDFAALRAAHLPDEPDPEVRAEWGQD